LVKPETLEDGVRVREAQQRGPRDGRVTFAAIETAGVEGVLAQSGRTASHAPIDRCGTGAFAIPKRGGKVRVLGIPAIRDRVCKGRFKLILEPIFEADFCHGSYGYDRGGRHMRRWLGWKRTSSRGKTRVIDVDLAAYFDTVRHDLLLGKVPVGSRTARSCHLLKLMRNASGSGACPKAGCSRRCWRTSISRRWMRCWSGPWTVTQEGAYTRVDYARYADDLVILVDCTVGMYWLLKAVHRRLRRSSRSSICG